MIHRLGFEGLKNYADGTAEAALMHHLKRAVQDCDSRPGDDKARVVTVSIMLKPVLLQDGSASQLHTEVEVSSKVPKHVTRPVHCFVKQDGSAVFNDLAPDNPLQKTLDENGDD